MRKFAKHVAWVCLAIGTLGLASCQKDDPTPEVPQEEVAKAKLTFVEVEWHNDHSHDIEDPEIVEVEFDEQGLPPAGTHVHLDEGKTYRLTLTAYDFAGREIQEEFVEEADRHQVFLLGAPDGVFDYTYADADDARVGVTGYLHVLEATESGFVFNYILRHLNAGVKANITADDWNNANYTQFGGANDLNLKVEVHVVEDHDHDHDDHDDHDHGH